MNRKVLIRQLLRESLMDDSIKDEGILNGLTHTKILDSNGDPLVVYRSQKNNRKQGVNRVSDMKGVYFSADEESTKIYGENTRKYYLNIEHPIILKDNEWNLSLIPNYLYQNLINKGYDGAIWLRNGVMYEIVAFYDSQIIPIS